MQIVDTTMQSESGSEFRKKEEKKTATRPHSRAESESEYI